MTKLAVAMGFLALNAYVYYFSGISAQEPPRRSFAEFPLELDGWACDQREKMDEDTEQNLGVTDYLVCNYEPVPKRNSMNVNSIGMYVGYHARQVREGSQYTTGSTSIHPPRHCLPGSGWNVVKSDTVTIEMPGFPNGRGRVKRLVAAKSEHRQLVYYWYHSRGHVIADDWRKLILLFWDRATRGRSDGSLVRFTVPLTHSQASMTKAEAAFRELASQVVPRLDAYVPD